MAGMAARSAREVAAGTDTGTTAGAAEATAEVEAAVEQTGTGELAARRGAP